MLIEVNEIESCKLDIQFAADPYVVEETRADVVQRFKQAKVPGFRDGKAPTEAIKTHFRKEIDEALVQELAKNAYSMVLAEKNIKPFGQPQFKSLDLNGNTFKCNFHINKIPDFELKQYKGFDIPKQATPDADFLSEKMLQELRITNGKIVPFTDDDLVQDTDTVIVNFVGHLPDDQDLSFRMDGEMFVVGQYDLGLLNENVLGMHVGEKRQFVYVVPDNTVERFKHLIGKNLQCEIELVMGSKATPHALDDELANKVGCKNLQELVNLVKSTAANRAQELEQKYITGQIAMRLNEHHVFDVPEWLTIFEAKSLSKQYNSNWDNISEIEKEKFIEYAIRNVKLSLILNKIREEEPEAQLADEEVMKFIGMNLAKYKQSIPNMANKSDNEVLDTLNKSGYMPSLVASIRDDFALNFIIKNCNIIE